MTSYPMMNWRDASRSFSARTGAGAVLLLFAAGLAVAEDAAEPDTVPMIRIDEAPGEETLAPAEPSVLFRETLSKPRPAAPWMLPLRPLSGRAGHGDPARLQGQEAEAEFSLLLPPDALGGSLVLSHVSSINLLPEASRIEVMLNGLPLGSFEPGSFDGAAEAELPLEGSAARAGKNIVRLRAEQRHRIFCGPDASFALWTDIDLGRSGVRIDPASAAPNEGGFAAALAAQAGSGRPVEIRGQGRIAEGALRGIAKVLGGAQRTALPFSVASPWAMTEEPARARISLIPSDREAVSVRTGGDGALVLVVEHPADTAAAAAPALIAEALSGVERLNRPAPPPTLRPGHATRFADLGFPTAISNDYFSRSDITFGLPDDWLILASQQAVLELDYGFAGALPEGGLLLVKVNGTTVRMLPLDRDGGKIQPRLTVNFNARLLRPGINALSFEAMIPGDPPDRPCPLRDTDMLTILDSSSLLVPPSPRMRIPGMALTLAGMDGGDVRVMGDAEARSLPFVSALERLRPASGGQLVVAAFRDIPLMPLSHRGLTARDLEAVLLPPPPSTPPEGEPGSPPMAAAFASEPLLFREPARLEREEADSPDTGPGWAARSSGQLQAMLARAVDEVLYPGDGPLKPWLAMRNGPATAVLMSLEPERPERLWLVLGPDADPTEVAAELAAGRLSAEGPRGQVSVLRADGGWDSWTDPAERPEMLEPLSVWNFRAVLGNYASWWPAALTGALLGLAWITAMLALFYVWSTRGDRGPRR